MTAHCEAHLPPGWAWTTLGEVCEIGAGGPAPQDEDYFAADGMPFVRVQDLGRLEAKDVYAFSTRDSLAQSAASDLTLFPKGTVLFTKSGMSTLLNQRAILGRDMCVVSHIGTCIPYGDLLSEWVYYWLKTVDFKELTHATTLPSLQLPKVRAISLPVPPVPEQSRIVAKIEELFSQLDAGVEELKKAKAQLKRYRQSVLKAAFEGKLTEEWRKRRATSHEPLETAQELLARIREERKKALGAKYKDPPPLDTSELPELPEGWVWARLDSIAAIKGGITKDAKRQVPGGHMVPYLRVANVQRGYLDLVEVTEILASGEEMADLGLRRGDVLFTEGGDRDKLGRGWVWQEEIPLCIHQNHVFRARLYVADVQPKYVSWYGNIMGRGYFMGAGKQTTNLASINMTKLSGLPVAIPPSAEQAEIVSEIELRLSVTDAEDKAVEAALRQAARLRQSILKRAFEGRLVPQDPTDEPADRLLERIREERLARSDERLAGKRRATSERRLGGKRPATSEERRKRRGD